MEWDTINSFHFATNFLLRLDHPFVSKDLPFPVTDHPRTHATAAYTCTLQPQGQGDLLLMHSGFFETTPFFCCFRWWPCWNPQRSGYV